MHQYHLTAASGNAKTGKMPVSTTSADSCPDSCPLKGGECYAMGGPLAIHWRKVSNRERGGSLADFIRAIRALAPGTVWRHDQAGDLPRVPDSAEIDTPALNRIVIASREAGAKGMTYTHHDMTIAHNRASVAAANAQGFTVNLSANSITHADALADLDVGPVVTLLAHDHAERTSRTPAGRVVVQCPATYRDDVTCLSCQLCWKQRKTIPGFAAHGANRRRASLIAEEG